MVINLIKVAQTVKKLILLIFQGVLAVQLGFVQTTPPTLRRFNNQEMTRPRGDFIISKLKNQDGKSKEHFTDQCLWVRVETSHVRDMHQIASLSHTAKVISFPKCLYFSLLFYPLPKSRLKCEFLWSQPGLGRPGKFGIAFCLCSPSIERLQSNDFLIFSETENPSHGNQSSYQLWFMPSYERCLYCLRM